MGGPGQGMAVAVEMQQGKDAFLRMHCLAPGSARSTNTGSVICVYR